MDLQSTQGCKAAAGYIDMLESAYLLTGDLRLCVSECIFKQGNAVTHNASREKKAIFLGEYRDSFGQPSEFV